MQSESQCLGFAVLLLTTARRSPGGRAAAVIWHDRGDAAAMNLLTGPGGPEREPGTDFSLHQGVGLRHVPEVRGRGRERRHLEGEAR